MTTDYGLLPPAAGAELRERWRSESVTSVWRRPSDWYHPAVDDLAVALLLDEDAEPPAARLGHARGESGVGIGEAIDDLVCLYRVTSAGSPPVLTLRALCDGWADGQALAALAPSLADPESGLPTHDYLRLRVAECYRDDARPRHRLLVVDVAAGVPSALVRAARSAAVGAALVETFGAGAPMASLGGGVFAALLAPDERAPVGLPETIAAHAAAMCVDDITRRPVRSWVEQLPPTVERAADRLARLARM